MAMTHTLCPDMNEVRSVATNYTDMAAWLKADNTWVITHGSSLRYRIPYQAEWWSPGPLWIPRTVPPVLDDADTCDRLRGSQRPVKTATTEDGRIVSGAGTPWVNKWRANRALAYLGMAATHYVTGYGNDGPRGREWWIQRKPIPAKIDLCRNADNLPVNMDYRYTIERGPGASDQEWEGFLYEMKHYRKPWGAKVFKSLNTVGFKDGRDYWAFLCALDGNNKQQQ